MLIYDGLDNNLLKKDIILIKYSNTQRFFVLLTMNRCEIILKCKNIFEKNITKNITMIRQNELCNY